MSPIHSWFVRAVSVRPIDGICAATCQRITGNSRMGVCIRGRNSAPAWTPDTRQGSVTEARDGTDLEDPFGGFLDGFHVVTGGNGQRWTVKRRQEVSRGTNQGQQLPRLPRVHMKNTNTHKDNK